MLFVSALPHDSPFITQDQWNAWKSMDSLSYRQRIEGDWDAFAAVNSFAHAFSEDKHTGRVQANEDEPLYLSFDFNHAPVTVTGWQHYDGRIRGVFEASSTLGLVDLCSKIKSRSIDDFVIFVTGDKSGHNKSELLEGNRTAYDIIKSELDLTGYQIQTPRSNPNMLKSRELTNGILEHHPDFLISSDMNELIFDLKFVEADDKHQIIKNRNKEEGKADYLDSMRYYLNTYHETFVRL